MFRLEIIGIIHITYTLVLMEYAYPKGIHDIIFGYILHGPERRKNVSSAYTFPNKNISLSQSCLANPPLW